MAVHKVTVLSYDSLHTKCFDSPAEPRNRVTQGRCHSAWSLPGVEMVPFCLVSSRLLLTITLLYETIFISHVNQHAPLISDIVFRWCQREVARCGTPDVPRSLWITMRSSTRFSTAMRLLNYSKHSQMLRMA